MAIHRTILVGLFTVHSFSVHRFKLSFLNNSATPTAFLLYAMTGGRGDWRIPQLILRKRLSRPTCVLH